MKARLIFYLAAILTITNSYTMEPNQGLNEDVNHEESTNSISIGIEEFENTEEFKFCDAIIYGKIDDIKQMLNSNLIDLKNYRAPVQFINYLYGFNFDSSNRLSFYHLAIIHDQLSIADLLCQIYPEFQKDNLDYFWKIYHDFNDLYKYNFRVSLYIFQNIIKVPSYHNINLLLRAYPEIRLT